MYDFDEYLIKDIVHDQYDGADVNLIDFKRHLRPDVAVNKVTTKDGKGRPNKAEYYYNNIKYAEIAYEFETDVDNLITRRKETLYYTLLDGSLGSPILIKDKVYNPTNPTDIEMIIKEREQARDSLLTELKGVISGTLSQALGYSMDQIVQQGRPFYSEFSKEISSFIAFGSLEWRDRLAAIDLNTTIYQWLSTPVDANSTTLRDYIVFRLTY